MLQPRKDGGRRAISLLLALLMVLALPAAALEAYEQAPEETVETVTEAVTPDQEETAPEELPAPREEDAPAQEPATEEMTEAPTEEATEEITEAPTEEATEEITEEATETLTEEVTEAPTEESTEVPAYVDEDGRYLAPRELVVCRTLALDDVLEEGQQEPAPAPEMIQEQYTGVVAFYDYKAEAEKDEEERFQTPFFFYYQDGVLQDQEPLMVSARGWLDLRTPAAAEDQIMAEAEQGQRMVYVGREVYVDQTAEDHGEYLFAFQQEDEANGLFTGVYQDQRYENGLVQPPQELTEEATEAPTEEEITEAPTEEEATEAPAEEEVTEAPAEEGVTEAPNQFPTERRAWTDSDQVEAVRKGQKVEVSWGSHADAVCYTLSRSVNGGAPVAILAKTANLTYTDTSVEAGKRYVYTVRAYTGNLEDLAEGEGNAEQWYAYPEGASVTLVNSPDITLVPAADKITVKWKRSAGAASYVVSRSEEGEEWVQLAQGVTAVSYVDKQAQEGVHYFYTVQAVAADGTLSPLKDTRRSNLNAVCIHLTQTLTLEYQKGGVMLSWTGDSGARGFRIMRKASGEADWKILKDLKDTSTTTWMDRTGDNGVKYVYAVRAYYGPAWKMSQISETNTQLWGPLAQKSIFLLCFTSVYSANEGMVLKWKAVPGVAGYQIAYRTEGGKWSKPANAGNKTQFTVKKLKSGTKYYFAIRTYSKNGSGKTFSSWTRYTSPDVYHGPLKVKVQFISTGIKVAWSADADATGYRIFRSGGGKTVVLANLNKGSRSAFVDQTEDLQSGTTYKYTVRAYYGEGDIQTVTTKTQDDWGAFNWVSIQYLAAPKVTALVNDYNGIKVTYQSTKGAAGYVILRKVGNSGWKRIGTVTKGSVTTYTDASVVKLKSGSKVTYTVRAFNKKKALGSYDNTGKSILYLARPAKVTVSEPQAKGTTVTWTKVGGATSFYVYRKDDAKGEWNLLGIVSGTTYLDKTVTTRTGYCFYNIQAAAEFEGETCLGSMDQKGYSYGILWKGSERGWVKKDGKTYYVDENGYCLTGWQYLKRNDRKFKYYFDDNTGVLVTNMYHYFGKKMREMNTFVEVQLSSNDTYASHVNVLLYDSETKSYCIPAVTFRCIGNLSTTRAWRGHGTAYMTTNGVKERFVQLIEGSSWERYCTRVKGTDSFFHSLLYNRPNTYGLIGYTYNSMINNRNNSVACIRCQCVYVYLIQDIMKNGFGATHRVFVNIYHNQRDLGPYGIPKVEYIPRSQRYDPSDPAYTGKFFYETKLREGSDYIKGSEGGDSWSYY